MKIQLLGEFPVPTAMYKTVMYWISLLVLTMPIALPSVANADSVTLDDHGTAVCWLYNDCDRYDWAVMHVTVVTGNVWNHDDWTAQYFDLRLRDAAGNVLRTGMHVAYGAPAGTVVTEFDYTQVIRFARCRLATSQRGDFRHNVSLADRVRYEGMQSDLA